MPLPLLHHDKHLQLSMDGSFPPSLSDDGSVVTSTVDLPKISPQHHRIDEVTVTDTDSHGDEFVVVSEEQPTIS